MVVCTIQFSEVSQCKRSRWYSTNESWKLTSPQAAVILTLPADQAQVDQEFHKKHAANKTRSQPSDQTGDTL